MVDSPKIYTSDFIARDLSWDIPAEIKNRLKTNVTQNSVNINSDENVESI